MLMNLFKKFYQQEKCAQTIYHIHNTHRENMGLYENHDFHDMLHKFVNICNL